ncbi:ankyrin repeat domain-containing protein [Bacillus sp. CGMCC 1.60114]|uniref:ankyrin repeat domain-containing protein n=1 Tax=unclassified Bacillus (in: firmicutes) TaxID=185979 RepID=UPI003635900D
MVSKIQSSIGDETVQRKNVSFLVLLGLLVVMTACEKQDQAKFMIVKKEDVATKEENWMDKQLLLSAQLGDTETVVKLIKSGANLNVRGTQGETPVMAATYYNHIDTVKALLTAGADVNIQDNYKDNPFLYAAAEGTLEILKLTIEAGADTKIINRFGGTALIPAAERGHVEVVKELLAYTDIDVNHMNNLGWTALMEAVLLGNGGKEYQQIVQMLIEHNADVNIPDKEGVTPLQHAKERGFTKIQSILEKAGAY